jgi:NaMN:DMB phosphoribosyltransferase
MDRSLLDEALEARRPLGSGHIPRVSGGHVVAGTLPSVRAVVTALVGAEQEDVSAIHSGVLAELFERLKNTVVDPVRRKIDEMR